jgi:hypothetical protein
MWKNEGNSRTASQANAPLCTGAHPWQGHSRIANRAWDQPTASGTRQRKGRCRPRTRSAEMASKHVVSSTAEPPTAPHPHTLHLHLHLHNIYATPYRRTHTDTRRHRRLQINEAPAKGLFNTARPTSGAPQSPDAAQPESGCKAAGPVLTSAVLPVATAIQL